METLLLQRSGSFDRGAGGVDAPSILVANAEKTVAVASSSLRLPNLFSASRPVTHIFVSSPKSKLALVAYGTPRQPDPDVIGSKSLLCLWDLEQTGNCAPLK